MGYKMVYIKETRMFKAEKEGGISAALWRVNEKGEPFDIEPIGSPFSLFLSLSISVQYSWIFIFILHLQFHAWLGLAEWEVVNKVYIHHIGVVDDSFGFCTLQKRCPWYGCNLFPWIIERVSYAYGDGLALAFIFN